jgi:hypothetical protein
MAHKRKIAKRIGRLLLPLALVLSTSLSVWAQTTADQVAPEKNSVKPAEQTSSDPVPTQKTKKASAAGDQQETDVSTTKKPKRGQLIIAPIPITSPAVGAGLVLGVGYVFKLNQEDKLSPPSTIGVVGAFTSSGTRGGGLGGKLYFSENKYQTTFVIAKGRVNFDFYGIGRTPGRDAVKVPIQGGGTVFFGEFLRNVGKDIFVGPRYQHRKIYSRLDGPQTPGGFEIPPIDLQATTAALGFHIQRDKRDSTFYPRRGSLFEVTGDFFDESLGSKRQYQNYKAEYSAYREVGNKQVLAYRGMICTANQSVPFYDLCFFGANSDLRGYTSGEFQNRRMFASQAEYRRELKGRFGVVAFGGVGGIANRWNAFRVDELLPAAGAGLRFKLDKKNHINYRIDFAVGRAGRSLSIGIGEAF